MTLTRQATLHYLNQTTNIYELDLYQVDEHLYIVNYIAKHNIVLESGEITTQDLPLEQAQQIFNTVIQQKIQQGYILISDETSLNLDIRFQTVLNRLANKNLVTGKSERAIWRAGELKIKEAAPLLINLIGTDAPLRDYCIAWALGLCGSSDAVPALLNLYHNSDSPEYVQRIAFEALLKLADAETISNLKFELIDSLPQQSQVLARATESEIFTEFACLYPEYFFTVADVIYQLDNQHIRPALINILRVAPFEPNNFRAIRRIFKIAEYRCDVEIFAILAYRFERTPDNFDNGYIADSWDEEEDKRIVTRQRVYNDEQQDQPILVYSNQTQQYLRRRVWRTLKTLAETRGADYIKMATAVLLEYSDTDVPPVRRSHRNKWEYYQREVEHLWDAYADYLTFNHILYTNSSRYEFYNNIWRRRKEKIRQYDEIYGTWRRIEKYVENLVESDTREEAFPELWQQHPEALLKLLMESKCRFVHHFAVNALYDCTEFCASLNINTIIKLVYTESQTIAAFGFELALRRLNQEKPSYKLILLLINRLLPSNTIFYFTNNLDLNKIILITALCTNKYKLSRNFMKSFLVHVYCIRKLKKLSVKIF